MDVGVPPSPTRAALKGEKHMHGRLTASGGKSGGRGDLSGSYTQLRQLLDLTGKFLWCSRLFTEATGE